MIHNDFESTAGSLPVNSVIAMQLPETEIKYHAPDGSVWLRSGHCELDFAQYPDASRHLYLPAAVMSGAPSGDLSLTYASGYIFFAAQNNKIVYRVDENFEGEIESFDVSAHVAYVTALTFDGTHILIYDYNNANIHRFTTNLEHISQFRFSQNFGCRDFTYDGEFIWVLSASQTGNQLSLTSYTKTGQYMSTIPNIDIYASGLAYHEGGFYISIHNHSDIKKYDKLGAIVPGESIKPKIYSSGQFRGLASNGNGGVYVSRYGDGKITLFKKGIGTIQAQESNTELPYYMRIK
ncbi:hypothetical protein [Pseudoalteromonas sp. S16_S37]|uniref:hypothetical protein n=1 Tax=Pseudoalteromonas sp. S16_S37 TaxID=2720228 RepID=UPI00168106F7|nr:hypothetical protein [Pseudoalteromonas sp. S16_S37]MBD1581269.1 hypothetical protein [Pseudoalteromonas sp. S16_S37]